MEPWLSGAITDLHPLQAALLYSFAHAREDLARWTQDLTAEQIWRRSGEVAPVAFHILHIIQSVDRLLTYAEGRQLTGEQMRELGQEEEPQPLSGDELLARLGEGLSAAEKTVRALDVHDLNATREVGRKRIAVPLAVLLVHIAEHTQRHVGEAIVTAKLARGAGH